MARSGISYNRLLEWRLAARWALYRYEDFVKLDGVKQSEHVAAYRSDLQIEAVVAKEQARSMAAAQRRANAKQGKS